MLKAPTTAGITEGLETITAEQAQAYLAGRDLTTEYGQRPLLSSRYLPIAEDMRKNEFFPEELRDPMQFNNLGQLMNGQHRMQAQVMTGKTYTYWVVRGIRPELAPHMDQGGRRTAGDVLSIMGIPHHQEAASIVRSLHALRRYRYSGVKVGNISVSKFAKKWSKHLTWTTELNHHLNRGNRKVICSPINLGPILFLAGLNMPDKCEAFVEDLKSGANLPVHSPALLARERLNELNAKTSRLTSKNPREVLRPVDVWYFLIPAWSVYATPGGRMEHLPYVNKKKPFTLIKATIKGEPHDWRNSLWDGIAE